MNESRWNELNELETARSQLEDIIRWWDILGDVAETATGVVGHRLSMTGVHGTPQDATLTAVLQIDAVDTIQRDVEALAVKMGWRRRKDGDPKIFIHGHLEWAASNLSPVEWVGLIHDVHRRVGALTGHAPRPTARRCPLCGEQLKVLPPPLPTWHTASERHTAASEPDRFTCDGCGETRTSEEIETLFRWRISQASHAPIPLAAERLGIKASRIRKWISRGQLVRDERGLIDIHEARQLAQGTSSTPR